MVKSADEVIISGIKEVDDFFEQEKTFLLDYSSKIKDSTARAEKMTRSHKNVADDYIHISSTLSSLSVDDNTALKKHFEKLSDLFEKLRVRTTVLIFCTPPQLLYIFINIHFVKSAIHLNTCVCF
ncbi:unnamed protein product [Oncorhynchus mykiss]|uniref:Uncharacterized protein n=1 Tax=Oncorhynchus mykiss TaxID=8022 RepID=A0A061ACR0_ONCMY|nr:unnamed protein product [Oncorhynchus mykiss]